MDDIPTSSWPSIEIRGYPDPGMARISLQALHLVGSKVPGLWPMGHSRHTEAPQDC